MKTSVITEVFRFCGFAEQRLRIRERASQTYLLGLSLCDNICSLIKHFADSGTEDIFLARSTKIARKVLPTSLHAVGRRKLAIIDAAPTLDSLRIPPGNRLEALRGDRAGTFAIRINERFRVCFAWEEGHAVDVEIVDYH